MQCNILRTHNDDLAGMHHAELRACLLVDHILIKGCRPKQPDSSVQILMLGDQLLQFMVQLLGAIFKTRPSNNAVLALEGVIREVT